MIVKNILEIWGKLSDEERLSIIVDNYRFKEGVYILVNQDNTFEVFLSKNFTDLQKELFATKDYYSNYVNSNKAIVTDKRVFSANPFTYFTKICDIYDEFCDGKLGTLNSDYFEDKYFNTLQEKYSMNLCDEFIQFLKVYSKNVIQKLIDEKIIEKDKMNTNKSWIKFFYNTNNELYLQEFKKYLSEKIFNSNDFNIKENDIVYGVSDFSSTCNGDKPFLKMRCTNFEVPFRISFEDALLMRDFSFWLSNYQGNTVYIGYEDNFQRTSSKGKPSMGYVIKVSNDNGNYLIEDWDTYNILEKKTIKYKNQNFISDYCNIPDIFVENILDRYFFNNGFYPKKDENDEFKDCGLKKCYFYSAESIKKDRTFQNNLIYLIYLRNRKMLFSHFYKSQPMNLTFLEKDISIMIDELLNDLINAKMVTDKTFFYRLADYETIRLNLLSIYNYKGGKLMGNEIQTLQTNLLQKLDTNENVPSIENDKEYYFLLGQVFRYLSNKTKGENSLKIIQRIIKCNNFKNLKLTLDEILRKYTYNTTNSYKYRNAIACLYAYKPTEYDKDTLMVGLSLASNLLYAKEDIQDNENGGNENEE